MLLRSPYSKGNLYTMTIPEDFGNLYDLPEDVLNAFRKALGRDIDVRIEGPSKVSLFLYDNGMFIVENFNDTAVDIRVVTAQNITSIKDIAGGAPIEKVEEPANPYRRLAPGEETNSFAVTLPPHAFRVLKIK
jgi:predicted Zn-dependent protease